MDEVQTFIMHCFNHNNSVSEAALKWIKYTKFKTDVVTEIDDIRRRKKEKLPSTGTTVKETIK